MVTSTLTMLPKVKDNVKTEKHNRWGKKLQYIMEIKDTYEIITGIISSSKTPLTEHTSRFISMVHTKRKERS